MRFGTVRFVRFSIFCCCFPLPLNLDFYSYILFAIIFIFCFNMACLLVSWGNLYPHSFFSLAEAILEMVEQNYQFRLVGGDDGDGDDSR